MNNPASSAVQIAGFFEKAGVSPALSQKLGQSLGTNAPGQPPIPGRPSVIASPNVLYNEQRSRSPSAR